MAETGARDARPVVLTGATGFIGRHLQARLLAQGLPVRALVRPRSRNLAQLHPACEALQVALDDNAALTRALADARAVIYAAGSVRGARPEHFHQANVAGVERTAQALAALAEPPPLLLLSSLAASRPELSDYAASKAAGERALARHPGLPWTILRPPAVYGPGDREMLPLLVWIRRGVMLVPGPAGQRLSLLHVEDLAAAALAWLQGWPNCRDGTYAIDDGHPGGYDWPAIAEAVAGRPLRPLRLPGAALHALAGANRWLALALGYAPMLTPGKARELTHPAWLGTDNPAFEAATGWRPAIGLAEGARRLFEG